MIVSSREHPAGENTALLSTLVVCDDGLRVQLLPLSLDNPLPLWYDCLIEAKKVPY